MKRFVIFSGRGGCAERGTWQIYVEPAKSLVSINKLTMVHDADPACVIGRGPARSAVIEGNKRPVKVAVDLRPIKIPEQLDPSEGIFQ